jgi:ribosomal protein L37AE/L43A
MKNVVNLSDYRRPGRSAAPASAPAQDQPQYFCTRCDSADFKLFASGEVRCAHCQALIRNVAVVAEKRSG